MNVYRKDGWYSGKGWRKPAPPEAVVERILASAERTDEGCLITTAGKWNGGYRRIGMNARLILAHRLIWQFAHGIELSANITIDHTCHNSAESCVNGKSCPHRACVELSHLEPSEKIENWSRGSQGVVAQRRAKTHCPQGHPYSGANLYVNPKTGTRGCRACRRAQTRRHHQRKKA